MRSLTVRHLALVTVVPLALGTLAACGGSGSSHVADPQAGSSSATSTPTGTPTDTGSSRKAGSDVSEAAYLKLLQGAMSHTTTVKVAMTAAVSGGSYTMKGAMDLTRAKPAMDLHLHMGSAGVTGEIRLVDGTMYMTMGELTQDKFVKFDLHDPKGPLGSLGSTLDQLDPAKFLAQMKPGAFRHITFVGSDRYGRHFHATAVTAKSTGPLTNLPRSLRANLPKTAAYDTWLDSQGRLSRVVVSVPSFMKMTMSYSDYGAPVHIAAPPASKITTMPGAASSL